MRADPYPLKQVMSWERRYIIPTFQRDYEWTREDQWELLADDLEAVAERLRVERHHAELAGKPAAKADESVSPHFLGAIVLDRLTPLTAGGLDLRSVIDGQQRLTTLQLLIRALLDVAIEHDSPKVRQLRRLLRNPDDVVDSDEEIHKLWPRRRDRTVWVDAMVDEPAGTPGSHRYLAARDYFAGRVRAAVADADDGDAALALVIDAALDMFRIVVIDLDDNDDAQVIFEVLNGRQTPLSSADLVKNLLFLRAEQQGVPDIEKLYADHWEQFDDEWWKTKVGRGHAARQHTNVMLSAWLTAASGEAAHPDRLYGQVRRYVTAQGVTVPEILTEISAYASHYKAYQGAPRESDERVAVAYDRMRVLGANTALPLVLWLRESWKSGGLTGDEFRDSIVAIESYLVRRVAVGSNTRAYNQTFRDVLTEVAGDASSAPTVSAVLGALDGSASWPTDDDVLAAFEERKFYDNVAGYVIKLLLGGIEEQMRADSKHTEKVSINYDDLTIEHILPRDWQKHWPLEGEGADLVVAEQRRTRYCHRIGNLTLLNGSLNSKQSNHPWPKKRPELAAFSLLRLNADLVNNPLWDEWDEDAIKARASHLADVAIKVWPRPAAGEE